jgi:hypothetical protein
MIQFKAETITINPPTEDGLIEFETELDSECGNYCALVRGCVEVSNYENVPDNYEDPGYIDFDLKIDDEIEIDIFTADGGNTDVIIEEDLVNEIIKKIEILT